MCVCGCVCVVECACVCVGLSLLYLAGKCGCIDCLFGLDEPVCSVAFLWLLCSAERGLSMG